MRDVREVFFAAFAVLSVMVYTLSNVSEAALEIAAQDDSLCRPHQARSCLPAFRVMFHILA